MALVNGTRLWFFTFPIMLVLCILCLSCALAVFKNLEDGGDLQTQLFLQVAKVEAHL
jgi:hypothetical protein